MNKRIEEVAHLYVGCEVELTRDIFVEDLELEEKETSKGAIWHLAMVDKGDCHIADLNSYQAYLSNMEGCWLGLYFTDFKIRLRPLSDMTEEEANHIDGEYGQVVHSHLSAALRDGVNYSKKIQESFELFRYLLSRGFDLFDLIPDGLAIDKTSLDKT